MIPKIEERKSVTYLNNGEKIFGIVHTPLKPGPYPLVVICPGFAGNKCGRQRSFVKIAQELGQLGIMTLRFDYRGSGDSEGEFDEITIANKVADVLKCIEEVKKESGVDSARIGLFGRSLGGLIAILAARKIGTVKSLVLWSPVFDGAPWKKLLHDLQQLPDPSSRDKYLKALKFEMPNSTFLSELFEINMQDVLKELQAIPLLHFFGLKDEKLDYYHLEGYKKCREGIPFTKFVEFPEGDHDFSNPHDLNLTMQETLNWFRQTLV